MSNESIGAITRGLLEGLANRPITQDSVEEKDGILFCSICGKPMQSWVDWFPDEDGNVEKRLVPVMCRCQQEEYEREREERRRNQFAMALSEAREQYGLQPNGAAAATFSEDDHSNEPISRTCRAYVEEWDAMREDCTGIIFHGPKGTGKSFYAACIANALAEKQVPTLMTSTALIMNAMQGAKDKTELLRHINRFSLLVLDDLGAERTTSYGAEVVYSVIDSRYRAKLPLIVTTNLDLADMRDEPDLDRSRVYDRVVEMCPIPLRLDGESRRGKLAEERRDRARDFLRRAMSNG